MLPPIVAMNLVAMRSIDEFTDECIKSQNMFADKTPFEKRNEVLRFRQAQVELNNDSVGLLKRNDICSYSKRKILKNNRHFY